MTDPIVQRMLDREPCPRCGGDRLRTDFTDSPWCHAPSRPLPSWLHETDGGYSIKDRD